MVRKSFDTRSLVTKKTPAWKIGKLIAAYCFPNGDVSAAELQGFVTQVKKEMTNLGNRDPRIAALAKVYTDLPGTERKWFNRIYYSSWPKELGHFIGCMLGPKMVTVTPTWDVLGLIKAYGTPVDLVPEGLTMDAAVQEILRLVVEAVNRLSPIENLDSSPDAATQTPPPAGPDELSPSVDVAVDLAPKAETAAVTAECAPLVQPAPETTAEVCA
jgi:hypothetical protein